MNQNATLTEIKLSYFKLAKELHPDKAEDKRFVDLNKVIEPSDKFCVYRDVNKFLALVEAYDVLSNPDKRMRYDRQLGKTPYHFTSGFSGKYSTETESNKPKGNQGIRSDIHSKPFDTPYTHGWKKTHIIEYDKGKSYTFQIAEELAV